MRITGQDAQLAGTSDHFDLVLFDAGDFDLVFGAGDFDFDFMRLCLSVLVGLFLSISRKKLSARALVLQLQQNHRGEYSNKKLNLMGWVAQRTQQRNIRSSMCLPLSRLFFLLFLLLSISSSGAFWMQYASLRYCNIDQTE